MVARSALVIIAGQVQEMPSGDTLNGATGGGGAPDGNVIGSNATVASDTSYILASYLKVSADLTVSGNLMVTG